MVFILLIAGFCLLLSNIISLIDLLNAIDKLSKYGIEPEYGFNFYLRLIGEFCLSIGLFGIAFHLDNNKEKKILTL